MLDNITLTPQQKEGLTQEQIDKLEMELTIKYEADTFF